jgi:hypothetical protein
MNAAPIALVTCTRCAGTGIFEKYPDWADVLDKLNAVTAARDGTAPKKVNRSCVRCSGSGKHGEECVECGGPRPSHTYFCSSKNWPSEEDPATDEDRATIDAAHKAEEEARERGEKKKGYPGGAWDYMMKWLDRKKKRAGKGTTP